MLELLIRISDVQILLSPSFLMSQNVLILQTLACLKLGHHLWTTPYFGWDVFYIFALGQNLRKHLWWVGG